ncbi:MAG: alpha/beta hydrolase [Acidobacteria bacterium]|nr:alpha/beta hydrolase [Acidobacteriota bacterium]
MISSNLPRTRLIIPIILLGLATPFCIAQAQPGKMIDMGGRRLHIVESGTGAATVVFESGLGEDVSTWDNVTPQVASFARAVTYDRAGIGESDQPVQPTTLSGMAADLHSLLQKANIPPPYILVGHSLGGMLVQVFAHAYPKEIAGLVLVDPEGGQLLDRLHAHMNSEDWAARQKALDEAMPKMPPAVQAEMNALTRNNHAEEQVIPLPDVPVILLTGTKKNPEFPGNPLEQDLKLELHKELLAKIHDGKHVLAPNSRHYIQNDQPQLVVDAIHDIVNQRTSQARPVPPKK